VRTIDLTGAALDWAVARCEGLTLDFHHSTDWAQGGPLIEREKITIRFWEGEAYVHAYVLSLEGWMEGPTPLIAAMRCYVASKLGDDIDIPEELKP